MYKGTFSAFFGVFIYKGFGFLFFDTLKDRHNEQESAYNLHFMNFLMGAVSGMGAQLVSYPLDMMKKKLQVTGNFTEQNKENLGLKFNNVFRRTFQAEGVNGFWKGFTVNIIKSPIATGVSFTVKLFLEKILTNGLKGVK